MEFEDGKPTMSGLYVAYVNGDMGLKYAKRILLMYHDGWFYPMSDQVYRDIVYGFIGPLPALPLKD